MGTELKEMILNPNNMPTPRNNNRAGAPKR